MSFSSRVSLDRVNLGVPVVSWSSSWSSLWNKWCDELFVSWYSNDDGEGGLDARLCMCASNAEECPGVSNVVVLVVFLPLLLTLTLPLLSVLLLVAVEVLL